MNEFFVADYSEYRTPVQSNQPIFIVGMPRSGTTLMSSMLSAHPDIAISPESHFLWYWRKRYAHLNISEPNDFEVFWSEFSNSENFAKFNLDAQATKAYILSLGKISYQNIFTGILHNYASKLNKHKWGEKTPDHYSYLHVIFRWYPEARIIWMLRDPRAVTASLLRMSWAHSYIDLHAQKWRDSIKLQNKWSQDKRVILVKYETLVTNPEPQMQQICQFLGEEYYDTMICDRWHNRKNIPLRQQAPNPQSIEKWRSLLSPNQIAITEYVARNEMLEQGYQPTTERLSLGQSIELFQIRVWRGVKQNFVDKVAHKISLAPTPSKSDRSFYK